MNFIKRFAILLIPLLAATVGVGRANLSTDYVFQYGTGSAYDMSGSTTLMVSGDDDVWSSAQQIGFTFNLDGQPFTYFISSTNGPMQLGSNSSLSNSYIYAYNSFNSANCPHPIITAFFDDLVASGDGVRTKLFGSEPNRVRVVEWQGYTWYGSSTTTDYTFQVRLFEGSDKIELWYGEMADDEQTNGNGQIGAALTTTNYISIGAGSPPVASASIYLNDLSARPIATNTLYTLRPCQKFITIAGNTSQGGTARMDSGDVILQSRRSKVGTGLQVQPFTISMGEYPCGEITYRYRISGDAAGDYSITPEDGTIDSFDDLTPTLTFTPSDTGTREALLRITDVNGFDRSYILRGEGYRCVDWVGDPGEGGTVKLLNGDTIFSGYQVPVGTARDYTPIRVNQLSGDEGCNEPFLITYSIDDPNGNYSISPSSEMIEVGSFAEPTITFNAENGVGIQEATLTVVADGERRTFLLRNFISAPGGVIRYGGQALVPGTTLMRNEYVCVGESILSLELEAVNQGTGDFVVYGLDSYMLDTVLEQGTPPYPYMRDAFNQLVHAQDYFFSSGPGVAPRPRGQLFDSLIIPEGETRTFYLNVIPTRPGKRYARLFIPTNGFNLFAEDIDGETVQGLTSVDVFARGLSSYLAEAPGEGRPKPVVFERTKVRESRVITDSVVNDGNCDMRINKKRLRLESGDIEEFEVMSITSGGTEDAESYILSPGEALHVTVRFTPSRSGARSASMRLVTNDSTVWIPSITERGVFYWEFFGTGKLDLEARDLNLPPAVIGGETSTGLVPLENTKLEPVKVRSVEIVGGDGEITMDPNSPWPGAPFSIGPGGQLNLSILFTPHPDSSDGIRTAEILVILENGDTTRATITGYAGTRLLSAAPPVLFEGSQVPVGSVERRIFTVTNTGTVPAVLSSITVTGTDAASYRLLPLKRRVIQPGATEFYEVTYEPTAPGVHSATIEVASNATNGLQTIQLGGEGTSTSPIGGGDAEQARTQFGDDTPLARDQSSAVSGSNLTVARISPNPTSGPLTIEYRVAKEGPVTCDIFSVDGSSVRTVELGSKDVGEHEFRLNLKGLDAAAYLLVVRTADEVVSKSVRLVR